MQIEQLCSVLERWEWDGRLVPWLNAFGKAPVGRGEAKAQRPCPEEKPPRQLQPSSGLGPTWRHLPAKWAASELLALGKLVPAEGLQHPGPPRPFQATREAEAGAAPTRSLMGDMGPVLTL